MYGESSNAEMRFFNDLCEGVRGIDAKDAREFGRFPYVPASCGRADNSFRVVASFIKAAKSEAVPTRPTFLDAGCGIGLKVHQAKTLGYDAKGVELCKTAIHIARLALGKEAIVHGNLLTYRGYSQFDVVYLYRPMTDSKLQEEFEERLIKLSRPDVFIISAGHDGVLGHRLTRISPNLPLATRMLNSVNAGLPETVRTEGLYTGYFDIFVKPAFYEQLERKFM